MQSRYYDPAVGRFINADSLVTTGNGMASSNMFAYCLNNPVNGCDPCGTCFHRLDFWKDCERCAGKTWDEKLNILAADIYDYATDVYDAHMMQNEWQRQVDQNSFRAVQDSTTAVCEAIAAGIENQNNAQQQEAQAFYEVFVKPNPQKAVKTVRTTALTTSAAFAVGFVLAIPSSGGSIAAAALVASEKALEAGLVCFIVEIFSE